MIVPMLVKIDFAALGRGRRATGAGSRSRFVNWAVKPFSMALLGWLFIGTLFRPWLPAAEIDSVHRRADPARRRALHRDGVRLVEPDEGRAALHAVAGGAERR
jgi:hypothetical protein